MDVSSKKLYRAGKDHIIGGVCAGCADYLSIDVTLLRILWLVFTLVNGIGAVVYIVCLLFIPKNPDHEKLPVEQRKKADNAGLYIGVGLVVIGLTFAFNNWFSFFWWDFDWFFFDFHWHIVWPILLIVFGVWYIYRSTQNSENETADKSEKREFYRSKKQKMIGGVCGGLAEYWNVDVTLVRVGYALATVFTAVWIGVIAYVVMLIVVKEGEYIEKAEVIETEEKPKPRPRKRKAPAKAKEPEDKGQTDTKEGGADE